MHIVATLDFFCNFALLLFGGLYDNQFHNRFEMAQVLNAVTSVILVLSASPQDILWCGSMFYAPTSLCGSNLHLPAYVW